MIKTQITETEFNFYINLPKAKLVSAENGATLYRIGELPRRDGDARVELSVRHTWKTGIYELLAEELW